MARKEVLAIRLQKFLAHAGVCSRRKAEQHIREGRVAVDGEVVTELGTRVDPERSEVTFDGRLVTLEGGHTYLMLNKPPGFLTTLSDPYGRPTIRDLIRNEVKQRVYPVGRLDRDSEGLLLLTDDGELSHRLLHPRFKVPKKYIVVVRGHPSRAAIKTIEDGVEIAYGQITKPCTVMQVGRKRRQSIFEVTLKEGRKRQIRLMFRAIGYRVVMLIRTEMGPLRLGGLESGHVRRLKPKEISAIRRAAGLSIENR